MSKISKISYLITALLIKTKIATNIFSEINRLHPSETRTIKSLKLSNPTITDETEQTPQYILANNLKIPNSSEIALSLNGLISFGNYNYNNPIKKDPIIFTNFEIYNMEFELVDQENYLYKVTYFEFMMTGPFGNSEKFILVDNEIFFDLFFRRRGDFQDFKLLAYKAVFGLSNLFVEFPAMLFGEEKGEKLSKLIIRDMSNPSFNRVFCVQNTLERRVCEDHASKDNRIGVEDVVFSLDPVFSSLVI